MTALPGLELDARYAVAQRVGGDLYDFFPLGGSRFGVAVADVSGKGIAASLLMAICRTNLRQIAPRCASPVETLIELNRVLTADIHPGLFITLTYAIIDVAGGEVALARAGHELPLLVRRRAETGLVQVDFLTSEGMALGLVPGEVFDQSIEARVEAFRPGDLLVLYTDGITEAVNEEGKEFSGARLADSVRSLYGRSPREINAGILEAVERFAGETPQRDDLTLVTVARV
jgi:sigma-B regulation protein RsbU (phosphoserine phosphatase)